MYRTKVAVLVIGFALLLAELPGLALAQTVTIDNDIPQGTLGHWSVVVRSGGESRLAFVTAERATSGDVFTENVLFDYFSYVDVGSEGGAFQLSGSAPIADVSDPDTVSSSGSFTGTNSNTINWTVVSSIPDDGLVMTSQFTFEAADGGSIGKLRFLQYLDEDVEGVGDDVFFTKGTPAGQNLELFTVDNLEIYGVSQSGAFGEIGGLENATFAGWAADTYDNMRPRITGAGQPVTPEGIINNLPILNHPELGTVLGPRDIVSVLAWDIDSEASTAVVITSLGGVPDFQGVFTPPVLPPPGTRAIFAEGGIIGDIDPARPTIVLTHGLTVDNFNPLTSPAKLWTGFISEHSAGRLLENVLGDQANIIQYVWEEAFQAGNPIFDFPRGGTYIAGRRGVYDAGEALANDLLDALGVGYSEDIHFIGHSLGTPVNAYAARRFLSEAIGVSRAQFTILDYPNHITKIPGINQEEEDQFGFDPNFFAAVLSIFRDDLDLRIDNYFASSDIQTFAGVGDIVNGPAYNHLRRPPDQRSGLINPNNIDDTIVDDNAASNDHSGVHQWYRWTVFPNDPFPIGPTVCDGDEFDEARRPSTGLGVPFDDSLNPCEKGWFWAINNPDLTVEPWEERFPHNNGDPIIISTREVLTLENFIAFGCDIEIVGASPLIECLEASSPFVVAEVDIPEDAQFISFEYRFTSIGDGDYAAILLENIPIWVLSGENVIQEGEFVDSGPIPIGGLTGNRRLTVALYGVAEPNAEFQIRNFRTIATLVAEPVEIDIRPSKEPNPVNLKSKDVIPIAILTTDSFDATMVDPLSVAFGPNSAVEAHGRGHIKDADKDGDLDLLLHFAVQETGISCSDTEATLTGETFDGQAISGSDSIKTVPCR